MGEQLCISLARAPTSEPGEAVALLGAKGAALSRLVAMGLPVPRGFVLTTAACRSFRADGWSDELDAALTRGLDELETHTGCRLGDPADPLLVSVRGGSPESMPGMLATVLDVGATDEVVAALDEAGRRRFGEDLRRRFRSSFDAAADAPAPTGPRAQLRAAVEAVFASADTDRVRVYRAAAGLDEGPATAVIIQTMVFGNRDDASGTGVAFSRDPSTGEQTLVGEYRPRAQGDEIVGGTRPPTDLVAFRADQPQLAAELDDAAALLEGEWGAAVEIEFTVESGTLWFLQVRPAVHRVRATSRLAIATADDTAGVIAEGVAASAGRAAGVVVTTNEAAIEAAERGIDVVLFRPATSPSDIAGLAAACALVTGTGGMASHAAVIARGWGVPAVVGIGEMEVAADWVRIGETIYPAGTMVTVDGDRGRVTLGVSPGGATPSDEERVLRAQRAAAAQGRVDAPEANPLDLADGTEDRVLDEKTLSAFAVVDAAVKQVISDWQLEGDDDLVVQTLVHDVGPAAEPVLMALAAADDRFTRFRERLASSLAGIASGDLGLIADPLRDSYHSVWFALHEEILALTGRSRTDDA